MEAKSFSTMVGICLFLGERFPPQTARNELSISIAILVGRDRFGLITTWIGNSQNIYFDDLRYTCSQNE